MQLENIQKLFAKDIINNQARGAYLQQQGFNRADLIQIYSNNYITSLTNVLKASYSCIVRLVGNDFFKFVAREYIAKHPVKTGNIQEYGAEFTNFINNFEPCNSLPFLTDIAKLEYAYEVCYRSQCARFLIESKYPIIKIWQLNKNSDKLDINSGADNVFVYKINDDVVVERITPKIFKQLKEDYEKNNIFI